MPVCDCGVIGQQLSTIDQQFLVLYSLFIGQQLSTICQQFFSFFFLFSRGGDLVLIYAVTLGGVGDAVALYKQETVTEVLAGGGVGRVRLVGPVGRGSAYNLQLGYRFAIGDDAHAGGVDGDVTTEDGSVSAHRRA